MSLDCSQSFSFPRIPITCTANLKSSSIGTIYRVSFCSSTLFSPPGTFHLHWPKHLLLLIFIYHHQVSSVNQVFNFSMNCSNIGLNLLDFSNTNTSLVIQTLPIQIYDRRKKLKLFLQTFLRLFQSSLI